MKLPYELFLLDQRLPVIFRIHMAAAGLALMLISAALLARPHPGWHRLLGRLASVAVITGGVTALPSALLSEATWTARAGFLVQACVWLVLLGAGLSAIRAGRIANHRDAMLSMLAVASGAVWLRFAMAAAAGLQLPFQCTYAILAWASWLVPLVVVWRLTRASRAPDTPSCDRELCRPPRRFARMQDDGRSRSHRFAWPDRRDKGW